MKQPKINCFEVVTEYKNTTKLFNTLEEAKLFYVKLAPSKSLWHYDEQGRPTRLDFKSKFQ